MEGPIKTFVVLVMENRSFDHMLGWMKTLNPEIDGVTGNESNPVSTTDASAGTVVFGDKAEYADPDPGHSFQAIREQIFGSEDTSADPPPMNGFAQQANKHGGDSMVQAVMNGFRPEAVPVYASLVSEFAVCDRWFASLPASTQPNRLYVHSATSNGTMSNDSKKLKAGFPQKTIFDSVHESGLDFGIYHHMLPTTLFYKSLRKPKYLTKFHTYDIEFKLHAKLGKLPNYVVIEARYYDMVVAHANDDHPSHDVAEGQKFIKDVYETLRSSPQWNEILWVIIYDEHGGFFDHVPTPVTGVPNPDDLVGPSPFNFTFNRLGVRVPAIMVSPWIEKGTVLHAPTGPEPTSQYEHSSVPATVKKLFGLKSDFLTKRDAWAGTFECVLNRKTPRTDCPEKLPEPKKIRDREANEDSKLSEFQQELMQLAAALKGDHGLLNKLDDIKDMTVSQASSYFHHSVKKFLEAGHHSKSVSSQKETVSKGSSLHTCCKGVM